MDSINLQPTDAGYAAIRDRMLDSIQRHNEALALANKFADEFTDNDGELEILVSEAMSLLISERERSIVELQAAADDITRYLDTKKED